MGQARELEYDINGMIRHNGKLYLRMGNLLALFEDGVLTPLSVGESNEILYTVAPTTDNVPGIQILAKQKVFLERLTPDICVDVEGRYWYLPKGAETPDNADAQQTFAFRRFAQHPH